MSRLSPGEWHKQLSRSLARNAAQRRELLFRARQSLAVQKAIREACTRDFLFWVSLCVVQFNPNAPINEEVGPFVSWDFQDAAFLDMLAAVENRHDLVIEKSREMGASWMCLILLLWLWLFHPDKQMGAISKNRDAVDSHSKGSLFWKLDFMLRHLPRWMQPKPKRVKCHLGNLENGSQITGMATTEKAGVGDRWLCGFLDEFSQMDEGDEILDRTADTTKCRIFNFTHTGIDTAAYRLSVRKDVKKLNLHWSQHPEKNRGLYRVRNGKVEVIDKTYPFPADFEFVTDGSPTGGPYPGLRSPWYDAECRRRNNPRAVAMDLDINPQGAMVQFFNPLLIQEHDREYGTEPYWQGEIEYEEQTGRDARLVMSEAPLAPGRTRVSGLRLWLLPEPTGRLPTGLYTAGADLAWGTGSTPSVLSIFAVETGEKILEFATPDMEPTPFARLVYAILSLFRDEENITPRFCWELNGPGGPFGKAFIELGGSNFYRRSDELPQKTIPKVSDTPGWNSGIGVTKRVTLEEYRTALYEGEFVNRSRRALEDTLAFRYVVGGAGVEHAGEASTDPTAGRSSHGDFTIADALAWKMAKPMKAMRLKEKPKKPHTLGTIAGRREYQRQREGEELVWV